MKKILLATAGNTNGASYELSSNEMQSVKGGYYSFQYRTFSPSTNTRTSVGYITEGLNGMVAKMYAKQVGNGGVTIWIMVSPSYASASYTQAPSSLETLRLISQYRSQATSSLRVSGAIKI